MPQPIAPQPIAPQPIAPQPIAPQPIAPQPIAPQPILSDPGKKTAPAERFQDSEPAGLSIKQYLNRALFELTTPQGRRCNIGIVMLIITSVLMSMLSTLDQLPINWKTPITLIEIGIMGIFTVEYLLRIYSARNRLGYVFSIFGLLDLVTILPLLLIGDVGFSIRLLRVFRMLKLFRYLKALRYFISTLKDVMEIMTVVLITIGLVVLISGNLIHFLEPENIPNAFEGCWWSIVTMTTVGYGDIVPITPAGRVVASILMIMGMATFAMLTGTISVKIAHILKNGDACRQCNAKIAPAFLFCPHCGNSTRMAQTATVLQGVDVPKPPTA